MSRLRNNRSRRVRCGGFTLVELLIAMTVTLILIFALAQAFAVVGEEVGKARAAIEMSGSLRTAAHRLQRDLQGLTVSVRPVADDGSGPGYFEILDGPSTDKDWNADGTNDVNPSTSDTTYGDVDDVITFTTRNTESSFIGTAYERGNGSPPLLTWDTYQSTLAEVVWWIQYQDLDDDGVRDTLANDGFDEPFVIYRRAMIIRPDLVDLPIRQLSGADSPRQPPTFTFADGVTITRNSNGTIVATYQNNPVHLLLLRDDLLRFYNNNDVSVRLIWQLAQNNSVVNVRLACNSLVDLTKRENRYAHRTILSDRPATLTFPPVGAQGAYPALPGPVFPFLLDTNRRSVTSLYRNTKHGDNLGEDVMVSNALAFDVQVFDPTAPLLNWNTGDALVPSDPAYFQTTWNPIPTSPPTNPGSYPYTIGYGAFVDLGYGARRAFHINAAGWSSFSGRPMVISRLYVPNSYTIYDYCTWSDHYESNGIDEDGDNLTDEGTDGFDNPVSGNYVYGVDDVGERETLPPYPVPLRGIQIRIRTWDPDSRQIRQATVVSDFVPE